VSKSAARGRLQARGAQGTSGVCESEVRATQQSLQLLCGRDRSFLSAFAHAPLVAFAAREHVAQRCV